MRRLLWILLCAPVAACSGSGGGSGSKCDTAGGKLPAGLTTISWDTPNDGNHDVRGQHFTITVDSQHQYSLDTVPITEAVRFDLTKPATVYGYTITWVNLTTAKGSDPLEAGLYPDLGYNGFDYWHADPYFDGSRCVSQAKNGVVDYVLPTPFRVDQPGLIYVAHEADAPTDPTFAFDGNVQGAGTCQDSWFNCHSGINLPQALTADFFQGLSLQFPYDYRVQLHVKYDDDPPASQVAFAPVTTGPTQNDLRFAWGDFDNDGFDDLLVGGPTLYRNQGDGTFLDVTSSSGLAAAVPNTGYEEFGVWGDYDNDGCLDLFISGRDPSVPPNHLLRNDCHGTGKFIDVTVPPLDGAYGGANVSPCSPATPYPQRQAATWVDLDGDGKLDLYVSNYNCGSPTAPSMEDDVYHNDGNGNWSDWTGTHGFGDALSGWGANAIDYDQDGDLDLLVNDYDLQPNLFFRNDGGGNFSEIAAQNGTQGYPVTFQGTTYYGHSTGTAWGDLDGDGDWDVIVANLAHPRFYTFSNKTQVLMNDGAGGFADLAGDWSYPRSMAGIRYQESHVTPALADFDQDGTLDLAIGARGEIPIDGRPTDFYWGNGDGSFTLDAAHSGLAAALNGWCLATADFDHDGDLDLMTDVGLFANQLSDQPSSPASHVTRKGHWLQVRAVGDVAANRAAIGATIRAFTGGKMLLRYVEGMTGQGCQDSQTVHFGLGAATSVDRIEVDFPGGSTVAYTSTAGTIAADQRVWLYESGTLLPGWKNPT